MKYIGARQWESPPSQAATPVEIAVPLKRNQITKVIYDRVDRYGNVVGDADAYVGRRIELDWRGD